ncbi:chaperone modulator CbpM [Endozoicomonas sp. SM1973]|uniref:Chaperone modulator CbpM n=1 Tax=Spartinivicinus marinus TaxID=2994442 RepID=A0A853IME3_9GAMM|nr:chaperone modulator CbpM [Spartinivicinus marinus]MCX4027773.1 hypothetical protein [Spartinivicinus marinus]NYZ68956.1 chaperone modulator CbpM [Spartinivicinus marinus]
MKKTSMVVISGVLIDTDTEISMAELCHACHISAEQLMELVDYGIVEPCGERKKWRFAATSIVRIYSAQRLKQDLGINTAGAALALDLIEEVEQLQIKLNILKS